MAIFESGERMPVEQLCAIGRNDVLRDLHGDGKWGATNCYADYAGIARKYKPKMILELGVYLGYSACAMLLGTKSNRDISSDYAPVDCVGIDIEREEAGSNGIAAHNIHFLCPWANVRIVKHDTNSKDADYYLAHFLSALQQNYHLAAGDALFDMVHVDGDHSTEGTLNAMRLGYAYLAAGGVMIVDDANTETVEEGVHRFIAGEKMPSPHSFAFYREHSRDGWFLLRKKGNGL